MRFSRAGIAISTIFLLIFADTALAQTGTRIIDTLQPGSTSNALPEATVKPNPEAVPSLPAATEPPTGPQAEAKSFVLRDVQVEGASHLDAQAMAALWQAKIGSSVTLDDIRKLADGLNDLYKKAGYALYTVSIPQQSFKDGIVTIKVAEGYVEAITLQVEDKSVDVALIKAYGAEIVADRPLRQAVLERYILLMTDLPGYKVSSRLEQISETPGAYRLVLGVQKKDFDAGFGFANLGTPLLSNSQLDVNGVANGLLREGDRTQIVYGFPPDGFHRYQYYGLSHQTPLGDDGVTLQLNGGYLSTDVDSTVGHALLFGAHVNTPLIRGVNENLYVNFGFDALNANNAILGSSLSDERTRALRMTTAYALLDGWDGTDTAIGTFSAGLPALGARRGNVEFGGPGFGKFNARLERAQKLPLDFVLRLRVAGQFSGGHLPASEQFAFGGEDFGRAFDYDTLNGDRGIAAAGELAYPLGPYHPFGIALAPEVYGFGDWGKIWNTDTLYLVPSDRAASAGIGTRASIAEQTTYSLELARDLERPLFSPSPPAWRVVFGIRRAI